MSAPFPSCIVNTLGEAFAALDFSSFDLTASVVKRPMRPNDENGAIAISTGTWGPVDREESGSTGPWDAGINRWDLRVEALNKHSDEAAGQVVHDQIAKIVRTMLYRDQNLRIALGQLQEEDQNGVIERFQRSYIRQQRYASRQVNNSYLFLSTTELVVETETV